MPARGKRESTAAPSDFFVRPQWRGLRRSDMNANDQFFARDAQVDSAAIAPLPASRKIYVVGSRPDVRVPMREIAQSDTPAAWSTDGAERNLPIVVYDTSGPYTDPAATIDIRKGLPAHRARWIAEREETNERAGPTLAYGAPAPSDH